MSDPFGNFGGGGQGGGSSTTMIIVIIAALCLSSSVGVGVYFYLNPDAWSQLTGGGEDTTTTDTTETSTDPPSTDGGETGPPVTTDPAATDAAAPEEDAAGGGDGEEIDTALGLDPIQSAKKRTPPPSKGGKPKLPVGWCLYVPWYSSFVDVFGGNSNSVKKIAEKNCKKFIVLPSTRERTVRISQGGKYWQVSGNTVALTSKASSATKFFIGKTSRSARQGAMYIRVVPGTGSATNYLYANGASIGVSNKTSASSYWWCFPVRQGALRGFGIFSTNERMAVSNGNKIQLDKVGKTRTVMPKAAVWTMGA